MTHAALLETRHVPMICEKVGSGLGFGGVRLDDLQHL
jgi:hypothetical protein